MALEQELQQRSGNACELCKATDNLKIYTVPPKFDKTIDDSLMVCGTCEDQIENSENMDPNHWRCLNDSMWSEFPPVQVTSWRMLHRLRIKGEDWPADLIDMMYMEDATSHWAHATGDHDEAGSPKHVDANGTELKGGDNVTLIKNLDVKGANFTAKQGTTVRRIRLVDDNLEHIEGKVDGQNIVILTKFVRKVN